MAKAFISHSVKDREFVEREIVALLKRNGIQTWYATDDIKTADQWVDSIQTGLNSCDWFVVVLSKNSLKSKWVNKEIIWASDNRHGKIVPVLIDDSKPPLILVDTQYVDLHRLSKKTGQQRLLEAWGIGPDAPLVHESKNIITNSIGMRFRRIEPGTFLMGPGGSLEFESEAGHIQHEVDLTRPYWLGIYPVTQTEYERVIGTNPSLFQGDPGRFPGSDRCPVEEASWFDAIEFCNRQSQEEGFSPYYDVTEERVALLGGEGYRLPTEAEWEYACRAGGFGIFCFGDDYDCDEEPPGQLQQYAWFKQNSGYRTHPVGEKLSNEWGLYDMHGNVGEWCWDWYGDYPTTRVESPIGPAKGSKRMCRGGSWDDSGWHCRSAHRNRFDPRCLFRTAGFRVVRTA